LRVVANPIYTIEHILLSIEAEFLVSLGVAIIKPVMSRSLL